MKTEEQVIAEEMEKKDLSIRIKELLLSSSINNFNSLSHNQAVELKDAAAKAQRAIKSLRPKLVDLRNAHAVLSAYITRKGKE